MTSQSKLTLGPLYYHWEAEKTRDFYYRIADEAPVDDVYLGEVVCSKREPFFAPYRDAVIERLEKSGKKVILSSLALLTLPREIEALRAQAQGNRLVEANDVAAVNLLVGKPFVVGPMITVLNEGTVSYLVAQGARRLVFASEMNGKAMMNLASAFQDIETEAQVFGRQPLAISMRCYSARAEGRDKDHCRFACATDGDGMIADTIDGDAILTINGTQTLSSGYLVLADEMLALQQAGISHFRIMPQNADIVAIAKLYRETLDGRIDSRELCNALEKQINKDLWVNGFFHAKEGRRFVGMQK